jgi:hypothetical protein
MTCTTIIAFVILIIGKIKKTIVISGEEEITMVH